MTIPVAQAPVIHEWGPGGCTACSASAGAPGGRGDPGGRGTG